MALNKNIVAQRAFSPFPFVELRNVITCSFFVSVAAASVTPVTSGRKY